MEALAEVLAIYTSQYHEGLELGWLKDFKFDLFKA